MSKQKKFIWLLRSSEPRKGPKLVEGEEHNVADYPFHVVDFWVKTGAAQYVEDNPKVKKEEKSE